MNWKNIVEEKKLDISVIKLSEIEGLLRIDPEYYQQKFYDIIAKIKSKKYEELSNLVSNQTKKFKRNEDGYFNYLEISNINTTTGSYQFELLPIKEAPSRAQKKLKKNDIVISTVRPNRSAVAIIQDNIDKMVASTGFCVLTSKNINPYYLFAFFKTKPITDLLVRKTTATMYPAVSEQDILNLPVPIPSAILEKKIEKIITEVKNFQQEAELKYQKAEQLLLKETNFNGYSEINKNVSVRSLKSCIADNRFDAEYWQLNFDDIINTISQYKENVSTIGDEFEQLKGNFKAKKEVIYNYIEIGDINISTGETGYTPIIGSELPVNAKIKFGNKQLITSKVRPNRGATTILDNHEDYVGSGAFTVLVEKESINLETLMVYLKIKPIKDLLLRYNTGTSYPVITDNDVLKLPIPLIDKTIQKNICELVRASAKERREAKVLLEKAKKAVEIFIEKNENEALEYLNI